MAISRRSGLSLTRWRSDPGLIGSRVRLKPDLRSSRRNNMIDLIQTLGDWFVNEPMVWVSGNMPISYEEGNPGKHIAPDVFVVRGVEKRDREKYLVWEEGKGPDLIITLTSQHER